MPISIFSALATSHHALISKHFVQDVPFAFLKMLNLIPNSVSKNIDLTRLLYSKKEETEIPQKANFK